VYFYDLQQCTVTFNNDRNLTYTCVYTPTMEGHYKVIVKFAGHEIPKSPFNVGIEKTGVMVNKKTYFEVSTKGMSSVLLHIFLRLFTHRNTGEV